MQGRARWFLTTYRRRIGRHAALIMTRVRRAAALGIAGMQGWERRVVSH